MLDKEGIGADGLLRASWLGGWNGQWRTTKPGQMSVCACCDVK
ncbi:mannan-binding protein [Halomonadaceae bacterium KBTZ08]